MEKMKMHSMNKIDENVKKMAVLFPECITEVVNDKGELEKVVDIDAFRQLFSNTAVEGNQERYQFTWPDKRKARALVNQVVTSTLRPCREESVNFDTTKNLYIEGDNLEVLKLLQETYLGKIKMIYIDPPYNTGNDFVYEDDFSQKVDDYSLISGQYDNQGNKLVSNTESNGRFHTDWLNMIYPRLRLAKDLLVEDGVIFISIDDNEISNMLNVCNEIFGAQNHLGTFIWKRRQMVDSRTKTGVSEDHEYALCYTKSIFGRIRGKEPDLSKYSNPDNDPKGAWMSADMTGLATASQRPNLHYDLTDSKTGITYACPPTGWRYEKKRMQELMDNGEILFPKDPSGRPRRKKYVKDLSGEYAGFSTVLETVYNTQATRELRSLFDGQEYFDFPKPVDLIKLFIIQGASDKNSYILDFFSGSGTTAHAVMKLNAEDGGNRKFIMVQLPENCDEKSEAFKAGYKNICEIGKERIRRAGKQILEEMKNKNGNLFAEDSSLDVGFRDLKLDSSNMNDVYYTPDETDQRMLDGFVSNIKEDRTAEDLLFQVMLDLGVLLSAKIVEEDIGGKKVFNVGDNYLIACFDEDVDENVIMEVAKKKPTYFVMRDSSLVNDSVSVNFDQIFARYSPDTVRKVL